MGGIREKGSNYMERAATHKIAAPKPIRARPLALTHLANSKWIETSPIKNDNPFLEPTQGVCGERDEETADGTFNIQLFPSKRQF
jgi:hypothetical protein